MIPLQKIRGIYERIVIDAAGDVPVFVENQSALDFGAPDEYCIVRINFGLMQEPVIGARAQWHVRGSLVCEIYSQRNVGPGRGLAIAEPIIAELNLLNTVRPLPFQEIIPRVGALVGPTQAQPQDKPHHFTRFSFPIHVRLSAFNESGLEPVQFVFDGDFL